jgi:hypothetical protein
MRRKRGPWDSRISWEKAGMGQMEETATTASASHHAVHFVFGFRFSVSRSKTWFIHPAGEASCLFIWPRMAVSYTSTARRQAVK